MQSSDRIAQLKVKSFLCLECPNRNRQSRADLEIAFRRATAESLRCETVADYSRPSAFLQRSLSRSAFRHNRSVECKPIVFDVDYVVDMVLEAVICAASFFVSPIRFLKVGCLRTAYRRRTYFSCESFIKFTPDRHKSCWTQKITADGRVFRYTWSS